MPPVIVNPGNQVGSENAAFSLTLSATDPDTTLPSFTDSGTLPGWATLTDHGDGTATITGTPGYDDAAITTVTITVSDGALTDDAVFDIAIANTNRPPTVDPIADQTVAEADPFTLTVTGSDPDLTTPSLTAAGLPTWATFTDNGRRDRHHHRHPRLRRRRQPTSSPSPPPTTDPHRRHRPSPSRSPTPTGHRR